MSNTNTNTNNSKNRNQNSGRAGQGQGSLSSGGGDDHRNNCRNKTIAKYALEGKMKDSPISKLLITKTGHRPTQFKKIIDTLPVLCTDKNFQDLDEVLRTGIDLVKSNLIPTFSNATR